MTLLYKFLDSTVGQKAVAAASGVGLIVFVVAHMAGNLQLFAGQDALNSYAAKLKDLGPLLWMARIGLIVFFVLHIAITIRLQFRNRAARRQGYAMVKRQTSTRSSRYMAISGSVILAFVIFHLMHFTFGWIQPDLHHLQDAKGRHDVYTMVVTGFQNWGITAFYLVSLIFIASHLSHAMFSALRSLGASLGGKDERAKRWARVAALLTVGGFAIVPIAVLLGWFS